MIHKTLVGSVLLLALGFAPSLASAAPAQTSIPAIEKSEPAEAWKGAPDTSHYHLTGMAGLGIIDSTPGFTILGAASRKLVEHGFVPDINNSVSIEAEVGPFFAKGSVALVYSAHLRWDFVKDQDWTFFALGGLAGNVTGEALGDHFEIYPRFGVGALWKIFEGFDLRGELSHEFMGLGAQFSF